MTDELKPPPATAPDAGKEQNVAAQVALAKQLLSEQNFVNGTAAGIIAMLAAALAWGFITVLTGYNYSLVAIGVGVLVGFAIQIGGKGLSVRFSAVAAVLSVAGCMGGNLMAGVIYEARFTDAGILDVLFSLSMDDIIAFYSETLAFMDLIFWLVAVAASWQIAQRRLTDEEAMALYTYEHQSGQHTMIS